MHKKLAADLTSLAHSILQMKNKEDVVALKKKAHSIYEKLSVLAYIEEYINATPNTIETKEELITKVEKASSLITEKNKKTDTVFEQPFDELEHTMFENTIDKDLVKDKKVFTLEEELKDTISVDVTAGLFEDAIPKKSLNDRLQNDFQIGLNDRIVFVKNLFNGSQEDFNRVISQLNTFKTEKEAKKFIRKMVKPDYNWSEKDDLENRFMNIIERRFS